MHAEEMAGSLSFPTVLAERAGEAVGFFSTHGDKRAVIAGPIVVTDKRKGFVTLRLAEAYENVLRHAGVREYLIYVKPGEARWIETLEAIGFVRWTEHDGFLWFKRKLDS